MLTSYFLVVGLCICKNTTFHKDPNHGIVLESCVIVSVLLLFYGHSVEKSLRSVSPWGGNYLFCFHLSAVLPQISAGSTLCYVCTVFFPFFLSVQH